MSESTDNLDASMKTLTSLEAMSGMPGPIYMATGFFDGVHRGHRAVLDSAIEQAGRSGGHAWVLTLDSHPIRVLKPEAAPPLLTANRHKLALLEAAGIEGCLLMPFTIETAALEPEEFVGQLCSAVPQLKAVCIGRNWQFGRDGRGDAALLARLVRSRAVTINVAEPVMHRGSPISSTRIRSTVAAGDLVEASEMLGRPFSVLGSVARGRSVGRTLGFPTANLDIHNEVKPPAGVYAVRANISGKRYNGVINIGVRPTFAETREQAESLEIHLHDVEMDLYGRDMEVFFVARIRDERRFDSADELKARIALDIEEAESLIAAQSNT